MLAAVVLLAGFAWFAFRSVQPDVMELSYPRKYKSIVTEQAAEYDHLPASLLALVPACRHTGIGVLKCQRAKISQARKLLESDW